MEYYIYKVNGKEVATCEPKAIKLEFFEPIFTGVKITASSKKEALLGYYNFADTECLIEYVDDPNGLSGEAIELYDRLSKAIITNSAKDLVGVLKRLAMKVSPNDNEQKFAEYKRVFLEEVQRASNEPDGGL